MKKIQNIFLSLLIALCFLAGMTAFARAEQSAQQTAVTDSKTEQQQTQTAKTDTAAKDTARDAGLPSSRVQTAPQEEIPAFSWGSYFKAIGVMLFLLIVFWYVLKIVRKVGNGRFLPSQKLLPRDSMYLEGQLPLGPGKSIVIVKVLNERLVLGVTEKNINLLTKTGINHEETFEELMRQAHTEGNTDA